MSKVWKKLRNSEMEMGPNLEQASFKQANVFSLGQFHETFHCIISCPTLWDVNLSNDNFDKEPVPVPCSSSVTKLKGNKNFWMSYFCCFNKSSPSKAFYRFVSNLMHVLPFEDSSMQHIEFWITCLEAVWC